MNFTNSIRAGFLFATLLSIHAHARQPDPAIPLNQELTAVDYSSGGRQTGCALRVTADAGKVGLLNILLSVFVRDAQAPFGMFKVVVKRITVKDGEPLLRDGQSSNAGMGKISRAWIASASGFQLQPSEHAGASHGEGYMTRMDFKHTLNMLSAIMQEDFRIGFGGEGGEPDEVFDFNKRIAPSEADKLSACMKNLRAAMEEKIEAESF